MDAWPTSPADPPVRGAAILLASIIPWTSTAELIVGGAIVIVIVWYFVTQFALASPGNDFVALEDGDASMVRAYRMTVPGRYLKRGTEIRFRAGKGIGWVTNVSVGG